MVTESGHSIEDKVAELQEPCEAAMYHPFEELCRTRDERGESEGHTLLDRFACMVTGRGSSGCFPQARYICSFPDLI